MPVDPKNSLAYDLLAKIISSLVDRVEVVSIVPTPQPEGVCFVITVHREDLGKVIGRLGHNARALRGIIGAVGMKMGRRYSIDIMDNHLPV